MGPIPALVLTYFTISLLVLQWNLPPLSFLPSGTVGPSSAKLFPYMQILPCMKVGPTHALVLPYFMISSLVALWDLPPLSLVLNYIGTVGPASAIVLPKW